MFFPATRENRFSLNRKFNPKMYLWQLRRGAYGESWFWEQENVDWWSSTVHPGWVQPEISHHHAIINGWPFSSLGIIPGRKKGKLKSLWRRGHWELDWPNFWIPRFFLHLVTNFQLCISTSCWENWACWSSRPKYGFQPATDVTHPKSGVTAMVIYMKESALHNCCQ